jgi:D-3-phosphoglycerate dehydrogenase
MLALARNLREADRLMREGHWAKYELEGRLLSGKVLGILGCGSIGTRVGQLGAAFGMIPIGCVEAPTAEIELGLRAKGIRLASLDEIVSRADFLSVHVPLTPATRNLINADLLSRVKLGSFLVNLARGGVADEAALCNELKAGTRLRGAALDVHQHEGEGKISPLATLPNVILTPHIGAMTVDTQHQIGHRVVQIITEFAVASRDAEEQRAMRAPALIPVTETA